MRHRLFTGGSFDPCGEPEHGKTIGADMDMAQKIKAVVQFHYPDHPWVAAANHQQGVATIGLPDICEHHFMIHIAALKTDPGLKLVVRGAGQILERYKIPRSGLNMDYYNQILHNNPLAFRQGAPE
jgi:hypothetical protein